jgi:hypothetical protein
MEMVEEKKNFDLATLCLKLVAQREKVGGSIQHYFMALFGCSL